MAPQRFASQVIMVANNVDWLSAIWANGQAVCDEQTQPASGPWTGWYYCSVPV